MSLGIWGRGSPYHGGPHIALTPVPPRDKNVHSLHSWAKVRARFSEWAKYLREKKFVPGETSFRRKVVEYCCVRVSVFAIPGIQ